MELTPERWRAIEAVVAVAAVESGAERDRIIAERCGADQEMRREVEALLTGGVRPKTHIVVAAVGVGLLAGFLAHKALK